MTPDRLHLPAPLVTLLALSSVLAACGGQPAETAAESDGSDASETPSADIYVVRGEVEALPDPGAARRELRVHHEAIDDLKGLDGEVWGMDAMSMPFEVAEEVSLDGVEAGDKIEFRLEIDWDGKVPQQVTEVRELPPETELTFRQARPPEAKSAEPEGDGEG